MAAVAAPELSGADDATILDAAATDDRCLVTENIRDFAILVRHTSHGGALFVHGQRWPRTPSGIPRLGVALEKMIANGHVPGANDVAWLT